MENPYPVWFHMEVGKIKKKKIEQVWEKKRSSPSIYFFFAFLRKRTPIYFMWFEASSFTHGIKKRRKQEKENPILI